MKIATYTGGMFGEGSGNVLSCCLCGERNYDELIIHRLGIAAGYAGNDYTFCRACWYGPNLGKRILQILEYPNGMFLQESSLTISEIQDER